MKKPTYTFKAKVFLWQAMKADGTGATSAWHFITVPKKESEAIKIKYGKNARGWGLLPVAVKIGKTEWNTSIFPVSKLGAYLLPLKAEVRRKEGVQHEDTAQVTLVVR